MSYRGMSQTDRRTYRQKTTASLNAPTLMAYKWQVRSGKIDVKRFERAKIVQSDSDILKM